MSETAPRILEKQPSETKSFSMNFGGKMSTGETISSITSITNEYRGGGTGNLTISGESISSQTVTFNIAGGTHGRVYRIEILIVTSNSQILEGDGLLQVSDT